MRQRVAERYPSLISLLNQPEIGKLLTQAVQNNWSPGVFQSKFMASRWFRTQSEPARRWWVTAQTDPAEARRQRNEYTTQLAGVLERLGARGRNVKYLAEIGLREGLAPDSPRMMHIALGRAIKGGTLGPGAYKTADRQVRSIGAGAWLREPSEKDRKYWAFQIALGNKTLDDFNAAAAVSAQHRFPHMAAQIRAGATVADIAGPMIEAYAREMDWDPAGLMQKMHTNPSFAGLLGIRDPKTRQMRMPTEYEARTMARSRSDWWGTTGGRESDAAMSQALLAAFGKRKAVT
jgi:hypothetical protein